jgi:uncharacterized C2H2 Zn-finger protein
MIIEGRSIAYLKDRERETMKATNKEMQNRKKDMDKYLVCPRCGALVLYQRRVIHSCFRAHLKEMEMDIARMGWGSRAG